MSSYPPAPGTEFVSAYNALLKGFQDRGYELLRLPKNVGDGVSQNDLKIFRDDLMSMCDSEDGNFIDGETILKIIDTSGKQNPDLFKNYPMKINNGNGFLAIPGVYNSSGENLYDTHVNINTLPILPEHLQDICKNLNSMIYRKVVGSWYSGNYWETVFHGIVYELHEFYPGTVYDNLVVNPPQPFNSTLFAYQGISYLVGENHWQCAGGSFARFKLYNDAATTFEGQDPCCYVFYAHYKELDGVKTYQSDTYWTTIDNMIEVVGGPFESEPVTGDGAFNEDFEYSSQVTVIQYKDKTVSLPAIDSMTDSTENDIAKVGCGCVSKSIQEEFRHDGMAADIPVAISNGSEGLRAYAYYTMFDFAGVSGLHYSLDVGFSPQVSSGSVQKSGVAVYWKFSQLQRPRGACPLLYWTFTGSTPMFAQPVNGMGYCLYPIRNGNSISNYDVGYSDGVHHVFSDQGAFVGAWQKQEDQILKLSGSFPGLTANATQGDGFLNDFTCFMGRTVLEYVPAVYHQYLPYRIEPPRITKMIQTLPDGSLFQTTLFLYNKVITNGVAHTYITTEVYDKNNVLISRSGNAPGEDGIERHTLYNRGAEGATVYSTTTTARVGGRETQNTTLNGFESVVVKEFQSYPWGDEIVKVIQGSGETAQRTTEFLYYQTSVAPAAYRKLRCQINYDGSWSYFEYDAKGRISREFSPFGNYELPKDADGLIFVPDPAFCRVTEYGYALLDQAEETSENDTRPRTIVEKIATVEVSRNYSLYYTNESRRIQCKTAGAAWNAATNSITRRYSLSSGDFAGRHYRTIHPDGRLELVTYAVLSGGNHSETIEFGVANATQTAVTDGTRRVRFYNANQEVYKTQLFDIVSNLKLDEENYTLDHLGRTTRTDYPDGSFSTTDYTCCGPEKIVDRDGTETLYSYTPDKKTENIVRSGVTTFYKYHANGQVAETRTIGGDGKYLVEKNIYSAEGFLTKTMVCLNELSASAEPPADEASYAVTAYQEERLGEYWQRTVTLPNGATLVEKINRDGGVAESGGTAAAATTGSSRLLVNGERCNRSTLHRPGGVVETTDSLTNFSGQAYKTIYPNGSFELTEFDAFNRPVKQTAADGTVRLTEYNAKGEVCKSGVDMNRNGVLDGNDPITEYTRAVLEKTINAVSYVVVHQEISEYSESGTVVVSVTDGTFGGNQNWRTEFGRTESFRRSYINDGAEKGMTEVVTHFDGTTELKSYSNGLLESSSHSVLGITEYLYDSFNRLQSVSHEENNITRTESYEYNSRNLRTKTTSSGGTSSRYTTYTYDLTGNVLTETKPGGRTVTYEYYPTGELKKVTGAETYPVSYTYESGRMKTLTTYRNYPQLPELTTWNYNSYGQLSAKVYADASQVQYFYNAFGQLQTRKWARNRTTTYAYDNAGRLNQVTYDGTDTPSISYVYDRRGRMVQVTDAAGTRTLAYNADNTPATETVPYIAGLVETRTYDSLGRETILKLMYGEENVYQVDYTYDAMSRIATISGFDQTATYIRLNGCNRLQKLTYWNGAAPVAAMARVYDSFNRLTEIGRYLYEYNDKDQRTKLILAGGWNWTYDYDELGQVISGVKRTPAGSLIAGQSFTYDFNTIGNRDAAAVDAVTTNYTANDLNQYTAIGSIVPTYDADGNMLNGYDDWTMEYNGENRLKTMYNATFKLEFAYDYMGRRFRKKVYTKSGNTWTLQSVKTFVYHGYKQIAEYNGATLIKAYIWQPPSSGDVDVPLWLKVDETIYLYLIDGNKNVRRLLNTNGIEIASYDYDPFGKVTPSQIPAEDNPFRFSSEYFDSETGLIYYNYRYYAPSIGRWINRDPIGEYSFLLYLFYIDYSIITDINAHSGVMYLDYTFNANVTIFGWDNLGLDRWINEALHVSVSVDIWNENCSKRIGVESIEFGPDHGNIGIPIWGLNLISEMELIAKGFWVRGLVTITPEEAVGIDILHIPSCCEDDKALSMWAREKKVEARIDEFQYNLYLYNCYHFALEAVTVMGVYSIPIPIN